jgi:hypothetical protein
LAANSSSLSTSLRAGQVDQQAQGELALHHHLLDVRQRRALLGQDAGEVEVTPGRSWPVTVTRTRSRSASLLASLGTRRSLLIARRNTTAPETRNPRGFAAGVRSACAEISASLRYSSSFTICGWEPPVTSPFDPTPPIRVKVESTPSQSRSPVATAVNVDEAPVPDEV